MRPKDFSDYRVDPDTGCWVWQLATSYDGYGRVYAHRLFYELIVGRIPPGLQIDHLCGNRLCVNVEHLEPVTARENSRRSLEGAR